MNMNSVESGQINQDSEGKFSEFFQNESSFEQADCLFKVVPKIGSIKNNLVKNGLNGAITNVCKTITSLDKVCFKAYPKFAELDLNVGAYMMLYALNN